MTDDKVSRYRAKLKAAGVAQINLLAPASRHQTLREVAKALRDDPDVAVTMGESVSSNPPAGDYDPIIEDFFRHSKAQNPKNRLEKAARALVERDVLPSLRDRLSQEAEKERRRLAKLQEEAERQRQFYMDLVNKRLNGYDYRMGLKVLRQAVHPDRAAPTPEVRKKALEAIERLQQLLQV